MLHTHEVTGSSPVVSTKTKPPSKRWWFLFWWLRDSNPFQWERCDYNLCGGMASRNVAAMIHRHPALGAGIVVHLNLLRTMKKRMSFRPQRSGVEESTTLEKKPTQDKIRNLGRFLDSLSLPRNDISGGGSVLSARIVFGTLHGGAPRSESKSIDCRGQSHLDSIDGSSPLHCVVPFNRTGCIRNVAGG